MPDVTVTLHQPAALGRRPSGGTLIDTFRHIPGSVLRGSLAAAWIRRHGLPEQVTPELRQEFVACFERGVRFGPLLAPGWGVLPLSMVRCKYRPEPDCHAAISDAPRVGDVPARCPVCDGPMVPGGGEVEPLTVAARTAGPATVTATRVRLTQAETAAPGMLFTRAALAHQDTDGQARVLSGRIIGGGAALDGDHHIHLGGRRSTAGQATCHIRPDSDDTNPAADAGTPHLLEGDRLVLTLNSPAVLVDAFGRPATIPDRTVIQGILGVPVPPPERAFTRRELVGGWHAASRLPKPDEWAVSAGSVYEYWLPEDPGPQALRRLADNGLGLRRAEGFGWITIGAWTPPHDPAIEAPPRIRDRPQILEDALADFIDRGLLTHLRDRAAALAHGRAGTVEDRGLLALPKVRELPPQRRRAIEHAMTLDAAELAELCRRLDIRLRGSR